MRLRHRDVAALWLITGCDFPMPKATDIAEVEEEEETDHTQVGSGQDALFVYRDDDGDGFGLMPFPTHATIPAGYVLFNGDCDDTDADVHPGSGETCNARDDDCDGNVDEGFAAGGGYWYLDADGDGFGDGDHADFACAPADGYVSNERDCDDQDPAINPMAIELCDAEDVDEDCDSRSNDNDPDGALGGTAARPDRDADGYGDDEDDVSWFCTVPDGWTIYTGDCDDTLAERSPEGIELCNGVDDDCDEDVDEDATDATLRYDDLDSDGYGDSATERLGCEGLRISGDCDDHNDRVHPYASEVCGAGDDQNCDGYTGDVDHDGDGLVACADCDDSDPAMPTAELCNARDDDCDGLIDNLAETWTGYRDEDRDGFGDERTATQVCMLLSGWTLTAGDCDDDDPDTWPGAPEDDCADWTDRNCDGLVAAAEDPDGDLSMDCEDCEPSDPEVHPGAAEDCTVPYDQDCDGALAPCARSGITLTMDTLARARHLLVEDMDGDGIDEVIASDEWNGDGMTGVWDGPLTADATWASATEILGSPSSALGSRLAAGDTDGDGVLSLLLARAGESWGSRDGGVDVFSPWTEPEALEVADPMGGMLIGGVLIGTDLDLDGDTEFWFSIPGRNQVLSFDVQASAQIAVSEASITLSGASTAASFGDRLQASDIDGDGIDELLVVEPGTDVSGVWVFQAPLLDGATTSDAAAFWAAGTPERALSLAEGDVDGDGITDALVGLPQFDSMSGRVVRVPGGSIADTILSEQDWVLDGVAASVTGTDMAVLPSGLIVVTAPKLTYDEAYDGLVGVYPNTPGRYWTWDALFSVEGDGAGEELGSALEVGDIDGDGAVELIMTGTNERIEIMDLPW